MEPTSILLQTTGEDDVRSRNRKWEKNLWNAIKEQDLDRFLTILSTSVSSPDLDYLNSSGKTLLQEAGNISDESIRNEIIKALLSNGADLQFALLYSVRGDDAQTVKILLKYGHDHASEVPSKLLSREHTTPLIQAAWLQNYEVVKLLLDSGFTIASPSKPHRSAPSMEMPNEKLASAMQRLNTYRGLASPVYIAASFLQNLENGPDPVYRACVLNKELCDKSKQEYEFSTEYKELSDNCKEFAVALLNECRSLEEIRCIMETNTEQATSPLKEGRFNMLEFAIKTENDKFVSHRYSQLLLNAEVYKDATFLEKSTWKQALVILLSATLYPVFFMVWLFSESYFPNHKVTRIFHAPIVKFLTNCGLYQTFLVFLVITAASRNLSRNIICESFIFFFYIGLAVGFIKDLYQFGRRRFFSNAYNYITLAIVALFSCSHLLWWLLLDGTPLDLETELEFAIPSSPRSLLLSQGVRSVGILVAFFYNLSFTQANPSIGPLFHAFTKILVDVAKFFFHFSFIFLAFGVSANNLITQFVVALRLLEKQEQGNAAIDEDFLKRMRFGYHLIFWGLFGKIDPNDIYIGGKDFEPLNDVTEAIFGVFTMVAVLVSLNMLIAILNESYKRISEKLDISWKFIRTKVWLIWIYKRSALPSPFSILYVLLPVGWFLKRVVLVCLPERALLFFKGFTKRIKTKDWKINMIKEKKRRKVIRRLVLRYLRQKGTGTESSEADEEDCKETVL